MVWLSLPVSLAVLSLFLHCIHAVPQVPCYFIFGDSLSDDGNNNGLSTPAKVNYPPYGVDYPQGPTGRFSNGKNIQDVIAEKLGFSSPIPPFASAGCNILNGVNYASGGAGILPETGGDVGDRISLDMQLENHRTIISKFLPNLLSVCIYTIDIGSNDYLLNYFLPNSSNATSQQYTPQQYAAVLIQQYSQHIQTLYNDGARKFALFAIGPIGCTPYAVAAFGKKGSPCVDAQNQAVQLFNDALLSLVKELNTKMPDAKFTYINPYGFPSTGFVTNSSCCQLDKGGQLCLPNSTPCSNRSKYAYWDGVHPTEAINILAGTVAYETTSTSNAYPFNLQSLALQ